jgi:hypothetical protein
MVNGEVVKWWSAAVAMDDPSIFGSLLTISPFTN